MHFDLEGQGQILFLTVDNVFLLLKSILNNR